MLRSRLNDESSWILSRCDVGRLNCTGYYGVRAMDGFTADGHGSDIWLADGAGECGGADRWGGATAMDGCLARWCRYPFRCHNRNDFVSVLGQFADGLF